MRIAADHEKVLCIERSGLPQSWLRDAACIKMSAREFYSCLEGVSLSWMPRPTVETDRSYKQLIPYVVLQTLDGLHTACYRRNGAESRLHSLWSVGIGGHINEADSPSAGTGLEEIVTRGMERELKEEFRSLPGDAHPVFHGVINEERTAVGHVHLGLVWRINVTGRADFRPGRELEGFVWLNPDEIVSRPLELWSRLPLNLLDENQG